MPSLELQSDRDRVLDATDLVALVGEHVALKPKGREHVGLCPFHDDRSPSLTIFHKAGASWYKCFACGATGNAFDFLLNFHKMTFPEALRFLAARAGMELTQRFERQHHEGGIGKQDLIEANRLALKFYRRMLADETEGAVARGVIESRGISPAMAESFQLGYAPDRRDGIEQALARAAAHVRSTGAKGARSGEKSGPPSIETFVAAGVVRDGYSGRSDFLRHRLVFPICDNLGNPIAFGGRKLRDEDEPKYLNSPESPLFYKSKSLYGIHLASQSIIKSKVAIVTEGYTDVIACHQAGFTNVVATLGTALTRDHAKLLQQRCETVILLFDGDAAGMRAADRGVEVFFAEKIDVKVCTLPGGRDPDDLLRTPDGVTAFRAALDSAIDALAYLVRRFQSEYGAKTGVSGKHQSLEALFRKLAELGFGSLPVVRRTLVLASLASITGLAERQLEAAVAAIRTPARRAPSAPAGDASTSADTMPVFDEMALDESANDSPVSRARRPAEKFLLALLLASPELAQATVSVSNPDAGESDSKAWLPICEALLPSAFRFSGYRELYRTWHDCVETGRSPTLQHVLAQLPADETHNDEEDQGPQAAVLARKALKGLASDLYLLGEQLREKDDAAADRSPLERLRMYYDDLERLERRDRYRNRSSDPIPASQTAAPGAADEAQTASRATGNLAATPIDLSTAQERLRLLRERGNDATRTQRRITR